jgi:uncharacterized protein YyaL (SSP411 family)
MANLLLHETSPYLLQHAHNPVNWRAWNDETLALAKAQNKLILVSIGYSACHWCHVMEKQCFENEEAARIMNKYFICIKVDREERPDIDAIYMQALQLMNGQGGWPLNCFTLPNAKPVYGGTYFPLEKWMAVLENLQNIFETNLSAMEDYAARLMYGMQQTQLFKVPEGTQVDIDQLLSNSLQNWKKHFDLVDGGTQRVPKFPMPCNYLFLLKYGDAVKDAEIISHVNTTLNKMSMGGLFDQLAGGFARYSTDGIWKVPHFEKMLYDNAQLVSLYSSAFLIHNNIHFKEVLDKTLSFVLSNFTGPNAEFYSALDADSEGVEGKYYVWQKDELMALLGAEFTLFSKYYNVSEIGYWEHNNYILMRTQSDRDFCGENELSETEFKNKKALWENLLLPIRNKRIAPGLDDKTLTSWNALMLKAFVDAYMATANQSYLHYAISNAKFIKEKQLFEKKYLFHSYKKGMSTINGFLEDYAFAAESFIALYKATGYDDWLVDAQQLATTAIENFYDEIDGLFYFNSKLDAPLITRHKEVQDNVIPASNSVMAHVLFELGIYFENENYIKISKKMCSHFYSEVEQFGSAYANWALLLLKFKMPVLQIAIPSSDFEQTALKIQQIKPINVFPYNIKEGSILPFIIDKQGKDSYYLCSNNVCGLPLSNQSELISALAQL